MPINSGPIIFTAFATALCTLRPLYVDGLPSRRTNDSCMPTDVPVGAAPSPIAPDSVMISTSTAGRHLQSMICCARIDAIKSCTLLALVDCRNIEDVQVAKIGAGVAGENGRIDRVERLEAAMLAQRLIEADPPFRRRIQARGIGDATRDPGRAVRAFAVDGQQAGAFRLRSGNRKTHGHLLTGAAMSFDDAVVGDVCRDFARTQQDARRFERIAVGLDF